ncbi:Xaa-Pro peptidase family protein [Shinella sp. DD12]|uniref:M24 family metallopeptidase n=1 Tax=Shinella sp. DD12 TaxID=1410620 RepID=UPI0003C551D9|nr:Xaa-Pro peptidase family protein [Shinella sp. DD12]EYR77456.1 putative dipeptidase PepE [Shinella sp. DD12]
MKANTSVTAFTRLEFETRIERARAAMTRAGLDAIVLTSAANVEYLSGFETQFAWVTPSRPWYFIVPRTGEPAAIIPDIGYSNWRSTSWCGNVMTWPSPRPADEGISLITDHLNGFSRRFGKVGFEIGPESRLGMPVSDLFRARAALALEIEDCTMLMAGLRAIKSPAEVGRIRHICNIAGRAFAEVPATVRAGDSEKDIYRRFAASLLVKGADEVPYVAIASGQGGYGSIIMPPTNRTLRKGDVLILDTGSKCAGYFCDFDRNFSFGKPSADVARVHAALWHATEAGIDAARPGRTAADVFRAQADVLISHGFEVGNVGRFGHGLGKLLTEHPSNAPGDETILAPGMVLTIEPSAMFTGGIMAHEEDVVVTENVAEVLTPRSSPEIEIVAC